MNRSIIRLATIALLAGAMVSFAGCKKEAPPAAVVAAPLSAPTGTDDKQWQAYIKDVVQRHSKDVTERLMAYYLPAQTADDYAGLYERQLENAHDAVARGVLPGNMLVFASPDSPKMADLVVAAFKDVSPGSMKDVIVMFIGKTDDRERVRTAIEPSGATWRFVEAR